MSRKALAIIYLTIFIDLLGVGIIIPILPGLVVDDLGEPEYMVGIAASILPFMQFLFAPFWGSLSDRKGRRPVMMLSIAINAVACITFVFANSISLLIVSRIFTGIGSANFSTAQAYVSDISKPEDRAKNMGIIGTAFGLGFIFGPSIGAYLKSEMGIEAVGIFTATLCVINLLSVYIFLPESNNFLQRSKHSFVLVFKQVKEALKLRELKMIFLVNALFIAAFSMMQIGSPLLWKQKYGFSDKELGYIFSFIGLCSVAVQGGLIGYFVKTIGEKKMLIAGSALMMIGLLTLPFVPEGYFIPYELLAILTIALANGLILPATNALASKIADRDSQGTILGAMQSLASFARTFGPLLSGALYTVFFGLPFIVGAMIMMICLFAAFNISRREKTTLSH